MGRTSKSAPALYGKLLIVYPRPYRRRYEQPMVQTFVDMLEGEPSQWGRLAIWARTLGDLPFSAAKEHLTNGKDLAMSRNMKLVFAGIIVLLIIANGLSFWLGNVHARQATGIEKVTPARLADAMQADDFYSSYGNAGLLFDGTAKSIQRKGSAAVVTFATNRPYSVTCQFPQAPSLKAGDNISVAAPGGSAERQPQGVLLHDCVAD